MAESAQDSPVRIVCTPAQGRAVRELLVAGGTTVAQLSAELARALGLDTDAVTLERPGSGGVPLAPDVAMRDYARGGALQLRYSVRERSTAPFASPAQPQHAADAAEPSGSAGLASAATIAAPHPLPEGASATDISACTFLNARRGEDARSAAAVPSNGGRVPPALYAALALDMCAVALVIPLLPTFSRMLGGDAAFAGMLQAVYGLAQVLGAGVLGGLSDRRGRRPVLQLSLAGGFVGYAVLAVAVGAKLDRHWLLLSRLPIGLTKQTVAVTRAVVTDCTRATGRAQALGRLAAAGGLGFVIGPALGGILAATVSPLAPPAVAVALFAAAQLLVCGALPETVPTVVAARELAASLEAARPVLAASARAHALNVAIHGGAGSVQLAKHGWDALEPLRAPGGALLPLAPATAIGSDVIRSWRDELQSGRAVPPLPPAEVEQLIDAWSARLAARAAADGLVCTADVESVLEALFVEAREARGMLPVGAATRLAAERAAERAGLPPPRGAASELLASARALALALRGRPALVRLCAVRALAECAVLTVHNTFPSYAHDSLGLRPKQIGYVMTCAAAMSVLVDVLALPRLLRLRALSVRGTALLGLAIAAVALPACGGARGISALVSALVLVSAGASLVRTSTSALMVNLARAADAGTVSGLIDAIESVCRVCSPLLGGVLLKQYGAWAPGAAACALALVALVELLSLALPRPPAPVPEHKGE